MEGPGSAPPVTAHQIDFRAHLPPPFDLAEMPILPLKPAFLPEKRPKNTADTPFASPGLKRIILENPVGKN